MKKIIAALLIVTMLAGCGEPKVIATRDAQREYPTYGLLNQGTQKSDKICYDWSVGNVVWSVIGVETIVMPIYFIGFSLFNPVKAKPENGSCGID